MEHAKEFVDDSIHRSKVCVFSKSYDQGCKQTRAALNSFQLGPDVLSWIEIENRGDCEEIQAYLKQLTGDMALPRVFVNGSFVGGADDTLRAKENGSLERNLEDIGAIDHFTTWS